MSVYPPDTIINLVTRYEYLYFKKIITLQRYPEATSTAAFLRRIRHDEVIYLLRFIIMCGTRNAHSETPTYYSFRNAYTERHFFRTIEAAFRRLAREGDFFFCLFPFERFPCVTPLSLIY